MVVTWGDVSSAPAPPGFLQSDRPTVYLDQWVWIRLASVLLGRPREKADARLLEALLAASQAGVAFPLSSTHYIETSGIKDPAQRLALADAMGRVSHFRTLRCRRALLREQLLVAMHEHFGRPMFRPKPSDPLGLGVHWAFLGKESLMGIYSTETREPVVSEAVGGEMLCRWNQWTQIHLMAGPPDHEVPRMREQYGYAPEKAHDAGTDRLDFEQYFEAMTKEEPVSAAEMRLRVQAREVIHENLDLIVEIFDEFAMPIRNLSGGFDKESARARKFIMGFFDSMPSVRVAVDAKLGVYWDRQKPWAQGDVYDTDAVAIAVPYCHVVVPDGAAADALVRRKTGHRTGTVVTKKLDEFMEELPELASGRANSQTPADGTGCAPESVGTQLAPRRWLEPRDRSGGSADPRPVQPGRHRHGGDRRLLPAPRAEHPRHRPGVAAPPSQRPEPGRDRSGLRQRLLRPPLGQRLARRYGGARLQGRLPRAGGRDLRRSDRGGIRRPAGAL